MIHLRSLQHRNLPRRDLYYVIILFWLFLATLNFITRYYYWIFIAFAVFVITPKRQVRVNLSTAFLLLFGIAILIFDPASRDGVTNLFKPFVFLIAYTIGFGLPADHDNARKHIKGIKHVIYIATFGFFAHYVLNLVTNLDALDRNTVDIWTNTVLSATGQACLASMCVGVVAAFLFSDTTKLHKILAIAFTVIIVIYNLILAGRTLLFLIVILFALAVLYKNIHYKKNMFKGLLGILVAGAVLFIIYNLDLFSIKSTFEASNFYWRFFGDGEASLMQDARFDYKAAYLKKLLEYPFGGAHIRASLGFYAHDLYLDSYDQYGIIPFIALVAYMISSIIRLIRFLRIPTLPFHIKQLVFCIYSAINIQFWLEPIMQGMPWLLVAYCLIDGTIAHFLTTASTGEVTDEY